MIAMTVYIEYVLIDNLVIDCLLLKYAYKLTGVQTKKTRLILSASFGAIFALLYPLIESKGVLFSLVKICVGVIMVLLGAKFESGKKAYITTAVFYLLTFALGGTITAVCTAFNIRSSETLISLIILPAYLLLNSLGEVIKVIYRRKNVLGFTYDITLTLGNKTVSALGFLDTGNNAYFKDKPMIFCSVDILNTLIDGGKIPKTYKTEINTLSGSQSKTVIILDRLEIYIGGIKNIYNNVPTCITNVKDKQVILHQDTFSFSKGDIKNEVN